MLYIGELLAATLVLAAVWLLAGMGTVMNSQCAALDEGLVAAGVSTIVGSLVGMYSKVTLKIGLAVKALMRHSQYSVRGKGCRRCTLPWDNPPTSIRRDGTLVIQQLPHGLKRILWPWVERQCSLGGVWWSATLGVLGVKVLSALAADWAR